MEMASNHGLLLQIVIKNKSSASPQSTFLKEQILELGGDHMIWSNAPENPYLN
jgi:putative transcriptional regulator